jgi:hypothetical protein
MLHDGIHDTLDALNQVRLSVHGLYNTDIGVTGPIYGTGGSIFGTGVPYGTPYGYDPRIDPRAMAIQALATQRTWGSPWGYHTMPYYDPTEVSYYGSPYSRRGIGAWGGADPFLGSRVSQTFPYARWAYSPYASEYTPYV